MTTRDDGTIYVFTFKEGLLSKVAHDLRLTVRRFEVHLDGDAIDARFWPESFEVDGAMRRGRLEPGALSEKDRRDILGNMTAKVLDTRRHGEIRFRGAARDGAARVEGQLELAGRTAPVSVPVTVAGGRVRGEVELRPTRWGIKPFKALLGAIKLKDRVVVRFDLPDPR